MSRLATLSILMSAVLLSACAEQAEITSFQPTGVIVGGDGSVYVSNKGTLVGQGEVLRVAF